MIIAGAILLFLGFVLGNFYSGRRLLRQCRQLFPYAAKPGLEQKLREVNDAHLDAIRRLHETDYWNGREPTADEIFQAWKDMHSLGAIRESIIDRNPRLENTE